MGFMDKAKAAATAATAKADAALANSGLGGPGGAPGSQPERCLRDLGVLAYLDATGRPASEGDRERLLAELRDAEARGTVLNLALQTAAPGPGAVPPPPGMASSAPPPPGAPPAPPASAPVSSDPVPPSAPPPPPPSWASGDGTS